MSQEDLGSRLFVLICVEDQRRELFIAKFLSKRDAFACCSSVKDAIKLCSRIDLPCVFVVGEDAGDITALVDARECAGKSDQYVGVDIGMDLVDSPSKGLDIFSQVERSDLR